MAKVVTSIDLGSAYIRIGVLEHHYKEDIFEIRALIKSPSEGLKNGHVVNKEALARAIGTAVSEAERVAGFRIKKCYLSIGGVGLSTIIDNTTLAISRADNIISDYDIERAVSESEERINEKPNIRILHTIPSEFKIDGKRIMGRPEGYFGNRLELRTLFIVVASVHADTAVSAVESNGIEVTEIFASPLAESVVTLNPTQRNAGAIVANVGAETLSLITHEDGLPTSLKVYPIGSADITNDIALGLKVTLEQAEQIKLSPPIDKKAGKRIQEIVEARTSDMLELIDTHLRKIGRSNLLPAGIVFTGEGANTEGLVESAKKQLGLPARITVNKLPNLLTTLSGEKATLRMQERIAKAGNPEWSTIIGLWMIGAGSEIEESLGVQVARRTKSGLMKFFKQFLP